MIENRFLIVVFVLVLLIYTTFIINNDKIIGMNDLGYLTWRIINVGNIYDITSIVVMVDNRIKTTIIFDDEKREMFKLTNYMSLK